jgi:uncharacterized protein (TIGR04222 family)
MDFLFDNPLANVPGVIFLVLYSLFIVFTLMIYGIWKTQADKTASMPVPPIPPNVDPYEIAYLRGGMNEVARAVIFSLRQKDFLIFQNDGKNSRIHRNQYQTDERGLNQMEQSALDWFKYSREPKEIFDSYGLLQVLDPYYEIYASRLEQQQLLTDAATRSRIKTARNIALLAILGLGAYKFLAAMLNGYRNVLGIVVLALISTVIAFFISRVPRLTALGRTYLERLQIAFDRLKYQSERQIVQSANASTAQFAGVDPLLLGVGVFGGAILAGTVYDDYNQAFQRAQHEASASSGSGGSSCGSSCSSSSGDGGGGDGGGGCGGGCGGCGGGGD